jgi:hypothetical protein
MVEALSIIPGKELMKIGDGSYLSFIVNIAYSFSLE